MSSIVMSWSKCKIEVGKTGASDAMAASLTNIGVISDKTTNLSTEDGDSLEAKATGGELVAFEEGEHNYLITTRVKEMDFTTETMFTGATASDGTLVVKTNIIPDAFSVKLTPKNVGAIGIKARKCHVTFKPGSSEEEGTYVDLTFRILKCADGELYSKFKVASTDWA